MAGLTKGQFWKLGLGRAILSHPLALDYGCLGPLRFTGQAGTCASPLHLPQKLLGGLW